MTRPPTSIAARRRRWALGVVGAVVTATIALVAEPVAADPIEDQRQRVTELTDELERLAEASDILAEEFVTAIDEQRRLDAEVLVAEQQVTERRGEVDALRSELGAVAVQTFMGAGTNGLGPMLGDSRSSTEQLQRDQLARVALSSGDATTDQLDEAVDDLEAQQAALEDKRSAAAAAAADVEAAKQINAAKKAEYEEARAGAESELGRLIQEEEERRARESYERMVREAEEAAARAAAEAAAQAEADAAAAAEAEQQAADQAAADAQAAADVQAVQAAPVPDEPADEAPAPEPADDQASGGGGDDDDGDDAPAPAPTPARNDDDDDDGDDGGADDDGQSSSGGGGSSSAGGGGGGGGGGSSQPQIPPTSSRAATAVNAALSQQGVPYRYADSTPGVGFDCSGLTAWAWEQAGVNLPHQSAAQYASIAHVPIEEAKPGDLIFYYSPISHVGMYIGNGQLVHAPNTGSVVHVRSVNWGKVTGVGRPG